MADEVEGLNFEQRHRKDEAAGGRGRSKIGKKMAEFFIILQQNVIKLNLDLSSLQKDPLPPLERLFGFQESNLPIGMGGFVVDSELYLTGGEKLKEDDRLGEDARLGPYSTAALYDSSYGEDGLNSTVYLFQPYSSVRFTKEHKVAQMNEPKTNPRVANVGGRIYILSCYPHCMREDPYEYPAPFECYDPRTNLWEVLDEPPNFKTDPICHHIDYFFVMDNIIYLSNRYGLQCYDVVARKWYDRDTIMGKFHDEELYWNMLNCVSAADGDDGFAIAYEDGVGLVGYILASNQPIKGRQSLVKINGALPNPRECREGFVYHLGSGRFCFILSTNGHEAIGYEVSDWVVQVYLFDVKVEVDLDGGDAHFETVLLHSQYHDFASLLSPPDYKAIQDVVFMGNLSSKASKKRVRVEEMDLNAVSHQGEQIADVYD